MIRINVDGVTATVAEKEILTAGRVGLECAFTFTGEWEGLFKTAVFQGVESVDVALPDNTCTVPWEAMQVEGVQLKIGVYGANGEGTIVIPTIWANAGKIQPSAAGSGTEPTEPSQNANAYAVETAEEAKNIALSVQQRADDGEFDGAPGADGFSPSASVSKAGDTTAITITDKDGTTTASINDGADGVDGSTLWTTTVEPAEPIGGGYEFMVSDLTGVSGGTPAAGDIIFYGSAYYPITSVTGHSVLDRKAIADTRTSIRGATGSQGSAGQGVPAGGTTGQVLKKASGTDYDTEWADESGGGTTEIFWAEDSATTADIYNALQAGKLPLRKDFNGRVYVFLKQSGNNFIFAAVDGMTLYEETRNLSGWESSVAQFGTYRKPSGGIPASDFASAVQTSLGKADTALQSYTETDPTVPSWAKAASKPSYTASEVGAIAAPSSPATGAFLVYNGSAWVAQTLSTWQGGNY